MIYLVRHGLDDESRIGGYSDVSLIDEGVKQVRKTSNFIKDNLNFNKIISSDVLRAKQTSEIINNKLGKEIIYTPLLREQDKGIYNGIAKSSLKNDDSYYSVKTIYDKYEKGESLMDLYLRIKKLLLNMEMFENNLLVTHRGVINMFYYILNNQELDMDKERFNVEHASVHKLDLKNRKIERMY